MSGREPRVGTLTASEAERRAYVTGDAERARLLAEVHDQWRAAAQAKLDLEDTYDRGWADGHQVAREG